MQNILIDGYNLGLERGSGVATYARNLSYELRNLGYGVDVLYGDRGRPWSNTLLREINFFDSVDDERLQWLELIDHLSDAIKAPFSQIAYEVPITGRIVDSPFKARMPAYDKIYNANNLFKRTGSGFAMFGRIANVALPRRPDLAHWTYPLPVRVPGVPNIYTLHDLVPLRLPYTTLDNKRRYYKLTRKLAKTADHIVTVSECSKRDIVEILGVSSDRVSNTYQSVEIPEKLRNKSEDQVAREVEGAAGVEYKGYYLFWGSIEPKKNIGRMIEAYLASKVDGPLVIVGAQAWKSEGELRLLNDVNIPFLRTQDRDTFTRKRVIQLSYVPFSLLVSLIRGAKAALFPSLYEGFGLPALEAMLLGTPVICTNSSSLPEVVGNAALLVDPYDPSTISDAIRKIDSDADLRAELSQRGALQAAIYSPQAYRDRLKTVYNRFLQ